MNLLDVNKVNKTFLVSNGLFQRTKIHAVQDVSFTLKRGEILGVVGESGCGKSTLARMLVSLSTPSSGEVFFEGEPLGNKPRKSIAQKIQMVFQNPYSSLNPRITVKESILFNMRVHEKNPKIQDELLYHLLENVGLQSRIAEAYPNELSGGERQRVNICRALATHPSVIVADEPTSALDKSAQAQVLNLLMDLKEKKNMSYVFISHDLQVITYLCDRVMVMYLGKVVEAGDVRTVTRQPLHPYTQALFSASLSTNPDIDFSPPDIKGDPPDSMRIPSGCPFHPRCPKAIDTCKEVVPDLKKVDTGHLVSCHMY